MSTMVTHHASKTKTPSSALDMPAPARRVIRIDVWPDPKRSTHWVAGWSAMELGNGDDYSETMNSTAPDEFIRVSRGVSARSAILSADIPMPNVWREYTSDAPEVEALQDNAERLEDFEASLFAQRRDH